MLKIKELFTKIITAVNSTNTLLGNAPLNTTAQTVTGAINELDGETTVSTSTGTVNSSITASRSSCRLMKIGNAVFITAGIGNKTSATTTSTTLFTLPTGYRPSSEVTIQGYVDSAEANFTISTGGVLKQTLSSSWANCFVSGFFTV